MNKLGFYEKFLILLRFSKNYSTQITRAMKIMFLLKEVFCLKGNNDLEFIRYNFGPFATNFNLNITTLINEELVSFTETYTKNYFFNKDRKSETLELLESEYINNKSYFKMVDLIKNLAEYYNNYNTDDLIQLCYFLKPKYAAESQILEEIEKHDTHFNQNIILKFIKNLDDDYYLNLFSNTAGILKLFNIPQTHLEFKNFSNFLNLINNSYYEGINLESKDLIRIVDNMCISDPKKTYKFLKFSLFEIISMQKNKTIEREKLKLIIYFFLNSLMLDWPLKEHNKHNYDKIFLIFKSNFKLKSFRDNLKPLEIDFEIFKEENHEDLEIDDKEREIEKKIELKEIGVIEYIKNTDIGVEPQNLVDVDEEYAPEEIEELEKSEDEIRVSAEN